MSEPIGKLVGISLCGKQGHRPSECCVFCAAEIRLELDSQLSAAIGRIKELERELTDSRAETDAQYGLLAMRRIDYENNLKDLKSELAALKLKLGGEPGLKFFAMRDELEVAQSEIKEMRALFNLQHTRTREADKLWQKAQNQPHMFPDLGTLIEWLMGRSAKAEKLLKDVLIHFAPTWSKEATHGWSASKIGCPIIYAIEKFLLDGKEGGEKAEPK